MAADDDEQPRRIDEDDLERFERAFQEALDEPGGGRDLDVQLAHLPDDQAPVPRPPRRRPQPAEAVEPSIASATPGPALDGVVEAIARLEERLDQVERRLAEMADRRTRVVRAVPRPATEAEPRARVVPDVPRDPAPAPAAGALKQASRRLAMAADRLRPPPVGVTILIYHRVGARTSTSVDLPTAQFEEQVAWLAEHSRVVTLDEAADLLTAGAPPDDERPVVVLTFDDGTADFVDEALPVLIRHRVPVTYYLATDFIDRQRPFPNEGVPMTWRAAREAVTSGLVTVGSHTHTHALLDRIPPEQAARELDRSIELLEEHVGVSPRHFAYPKAVLGSEAAQALVRERFRTATIARTRANPYGSSDLHRLTRSPVQRSDDIDVFARKVDGGMGLENDVRDLVNRWRYRNETM